MEDPWKLALQLVAGGKLDHWYILADALITRLMDYAHCYVVLRRGTFFRKDELLFFIEQICETLELLDNMGHLSHYQKQILKANAKLWSKEGARGIRVERLVRPLITTIYERSAA